MLSENDHTGPERAPLQANPEKDANPPKSSEDRMEPTTTAHIQCSVCGNAFRRPEHLKRHLRSHTKEKPFACAQCGRNFSRSDTLHRHELSHHTPSGEGGSDRTHRITVKTFRACFSCATARVRCSGGVPCGRCGIRSLKCEYPTKRRSKAKLRNESLQGLSSAKMHKQEVQMTLSPSPRLGVDHAGTHQMTSFSVNGMSESQPSPEGSTNTRPHPRELHHLLERQGSSTRASELQPYTTLPSVEPAAAYTSAGRPQPHESMSNLKSLSHGMARSGIAHGAEAALNFEHPSFDQSGLSTQNWLPDDFLTTTTHDQAKRGLSSHWSQSAVSNSHTNRREWQLPPIQGGQTSPPTFQSISLTRPKHLPQGTGLRSPRRYSHVAAETSQRRSVGYPKYPADCSVNQIDADFSNTRGSQIPWPTTPVANASFEQPPDERSSHQFAFPSVHQCHIGNVPDLLIHSVRPIEASTYNQIYQNFLLLCRNRNPIFSKFESETFPSPGDCNSYLVSYFHSFQAVYPLIHLPSFHPNRSHWILTLAIVAIGCHYSEIRETDQCTAAFHELIRRAILCEKEKSRRTRVSLDLIQAMFLNCIGLLHGENEESKLAALSMVKDLVTLSRRENLLASSPEPSPRGVSEQTLWRTWVQDEIRRRTGYCIWLLDCSLTYYFDDRPSLSLDDAQATLPTHEDLWQASDAQTWRRLWARSSSESLYDAVHMLYIEKRLITGIGDFSQTLLIHALYRRTWEVGDYLRRPLSFWNPTARKQSQDAAIPTGSVWLPGIPTYSKWRNSACDCLDILDWTANGSISMAAGLETPVILHLHAARVILLAPFREIRSLATSLATGKLQWSQREEALEWQYIWRWIKHDQYKARLSIVHAGATLGHVRRHSTKAFHEPVTVFLAVLVLWAYSSCHAYNQTSSPRYPTSRLQSLQEPSCIQLDRPCDDKLVQLFVREGHYMRGEMTGADDICANGASERVLRVGCEVLSSLTAWSVSKTFAKTLSLFADMMPRYSEVGGDRRTGSSGTLAIT